MADGLDLARLLGSGGKGYVKAMRAAMEFLDAHTPAQLLDRVGTVIDEVPPVTTIDKQPLQKSFGGGKGGPCDDLLAGRGLFYVTEQRRLFLDCTAGHYQMVWGYNHPELCGAINRAMRTGVVWDNHTNIPQAPVKRLAHRLVELANAPATRDPLDAVLLGVCTGSVACAAALKMQLQTFQAKRGPDAIPVVVVLNGNYHGTDMIAQNLRGMWGRYVRNIEVAGVEPNDAAQLRQAFALHGQRVAAFWAEPIMMNREAILISPEYLRLARELCDQAGSAMCIDEIQTGFWRAEVFDCRAAGVEPDMLICGKGMTAGFHPLAAVVYRRRFDCLEQYDAISTNGNSALPSFVALCNLELIAAQAARIAAAGQRYMAAMADLAKRHGEVLRAAHGDRHLAALKFIRRDDALEFHRRAVADGLWVRAHAYHEGHSTVLTKLGLLADEEVVGFLVHRLDRLLEQMSA